VLTISAYYRRLLSRSRFSLFNSDRFRLYFIGLISGVFVEKMAGIYQCVTELADNKDASLNNVDDKTGLTKRERLVVQKTWQEAGKIGQVNVGVALFNLYISSLSFVSVY
jgi:hypothetical protein